MNKGVLCYLFLMAALAVLAVVVMSPGEPAPRPSTFTGSFGEEFQYSPSITVEYNPHGGADRATFAWNGKPIGVLNIIGLPPNDAQNILREVITEKIKKMTGAAEVTHVGLDNSHGCHFECFEGTVPMNGIPYKHVCYVFFRAF